jgi:hypothetical protein
LGGHQVERIQKNAASPRWGWSGVREIVPPLWSEAELRRVAGLLPSHQSSIDNIVAELLAIGGRYHRNLHQDEFGPTRAERMQALRDLLVHLGVLSSRLEALPPQLQLLLSERFLECRSAAGQLDVDPVAFYSADKTAIEVVSETASDVRHTLASVGRTDEATLIGELCAATGRPTAAWIDEHEAVGAHMRAAIMTRRPGARVQAVHSAMRGYIAADRVDPSVPRRGRPRRK